jgi:hypothetical protein
MAVASRALCPFCRAEVEASLLRFGGHCPKCLIEIPGEETATDPGEHAKAVAHAEAVATRTAKSRTNVALGLVAFLVLSMGGGWFVLRPEPEVPDSLDEGWAIVPRTAHKDLTMRGAEVEAEAVVAVADVQSTPTRSRSADARIAAAGPAEPAQGSVLPSPTASLASDPLAAFSVGVGPKSKGPEAILLTDADQIEAMIQQVLVRGSKQLQQCYEQRLNESANLKGAWHLVFLVSPDGTASEIAVTPLSVSDAALEACMVRNVQGWRFQRIKEAVEINKTFRFSKSG